MLSYVQTSKGRQARDMKYDGIYDKECIRALSSVGNLFGNNVYYTLQLIRRKMFALLSCV